MKVLRSAFSLCVLVIILFSVETNFSSCKKDTVTVRDTVYVKDTVRVPDTANCNCYDLKDGLVAYYNFTNGNLNDSSGKGNHIQFNNAVKTADRLGKADNAYLFNGTSSFMRVLNSSSLNPGSGITLMAIVKMNGFYGGFCHINQVLHKGATDQANGVYALGVGDFVGDCYTSTDTSKQTSFGRFGNEGASIMTRDVSKFVRSNTWMTLVYTYDGTDSKIYVDGFLRGTSSGPAVFTPNTSDLLIGRSENDAYPNWWNGAIDELRIYSKALNAEAVKQLTFHK